MIEAPTVDYDRVRSSTATEDGARIVLTLDSEAGFTNVSLPLLEVPRLILAISSACGMAKATRPGHSSVPILPARRIGISPTPAGDQVHFVVEVRGGAELAFQTDRRTAFEFMHEWVHKLQLENAEGTNRPIQ